MFDYLWVLFEVKTMNPNLLREVNFCISVLNNLAGSVQYSLVKTRSD